MKYLFTILAIICATTIATLLFIWPDKQEENTENVVVVVNGHALTREAIQFYKDKSQHHGEQDDFIDEAITKQLLIAEAQRLNIDKNPSFRLELKEFYEHSLIKILMERVHNDLTVEVTDQEIDHYLNSFGKEFTFYTMKTSTTLTSEEIKSNGEKSTELFEDLGQQLQQTLAELEPGQSAIGFVTGSEKYAVYLENVSGEPGETPPYYNRDTIRQLIKQSKEETKTNNWIENLRQQASITFNKKRD